MQESQATVVETKATTQQAASADDLGLEVVQDTPQISLARPVRHIRAQ